MKIDKIDRFVIAVKDVNKAAEFLSDLLGTEFDEPIEADEQNIRVRYSALGLQLNEGMSADSDINKIIERRGEGFYCLVLKVDDLDAATKEMQAKGLRLVGSVAVGNLRESVFHPKDTFGVMIVLCSYPTKHQATIAALEFEPKKDGS